MKKNQIITGLLLIISVSFFYGTVGFCQDAGALVAKGHGYITFTGDGPLSVSGDGSLVVNKNCSVILPEAASDTDEIEKYIRKNAGIVYPNISGKVEISGEDINVSFSGANIGLRIEGEGTVMLKGYGIYIDSKGNAGRWSSEGSSLSVNYVATQ
jgi:hypothetical protein